MPGRLLRTASVVALACWTLTVHAADPPAPVVHSAVQLQAILASDGPTPLDAFTPYGKRRFLQSLRWGERGLGGFATTALLRELEPAQIAAVLAFIDAGAYLPSLTRNLAGPPLRLPAPTADAEARLLQIERFSMEASGRHDDGADAVTMRGDQALARRYVALFGERLGAAMLRALPTGDLAAYFDSAARVSQDSPGSAAAYHLVQLYEELRARGIDTRRGFDAVMLGQLLDARAFEQARTFVASHPHLAWQPIPTVHDPLGPGFEGRSVYRYEGAGRPLTREAVPPRETELVMVVDGGCHFSADALAALDQDDALRTRLLRAGLILLTPPSAAADFAFVEAWNKTHPTLPLHIPYSAAEWKAVDVRNVPRFFLLKEGKVVGQFGGWPAEGNKAALLALLDSAAD